MKIDMETKRATLTVADMKDGDVFALTNYTYGVEPGTVLLARTCDNELKYVRLSPSSLNGTLHLNAIAQVTRFREVTLQLRDGQ